MALSTVRKAMHEVINHLVPDNCRTQLHKAAEDNRRAICDMFECVTSNRHDITRVIKEDRRTGSRN